MFRLLLTTAAAAALATVSATLTPASLHRTSLPTFTSRTTTPTSANCHLNYFQQPLDHFGHHPTTFLQRYFWNDTYFTPNGPILYYTGNEADVTLYVNATGLMWENAQELGALLVFGEHRYYGETQPFPNAHPLTPSQLQYLSVEQSLADHVALVNHINGVSSTSRVPIPIFRATCIALMASSRQSG